MSHMINTDYGNDTSHTSRIIGADEVFGILMTDPGKIKSIRLVRHIEDLTLEALSELMRSGCEFQLNVDENVTQETGEERLDATQEEIPGDPAEEQEDPDTPDDSEEKPVRKTARKEIDLNTLHTYWKNGLTPKEIAKQMGVSEPTIKSRMKEMGLR